MAVITVRAIPNELSVSGYAMARLPNLRRGFAEMGASSACISIHELKIHSRSLRPYGVRRAAFSVVVVGNQITESVAWSGSGAVECERSVGGSCGWNAQVG